MQCFLSVQKHRRKFCANVIHTNFSSNQLVEVGTEKTEKYLGRKILAKWNAFQSPDFLKLPKIFQAQY